jgi:D-glycero-D-manno-heptose 1,7-bisphosphate phosphatase
MSLQKCIFLDRDGVLNRERGEYTFQIDDFEIISGVSDALKLLKDSGFLLIVITNQAGIAKGLYKKEDVIKCYQYLQTQTGDLIDDMYFCPHYPSETQSLLRKPDSLMLEKAVAKWGVDVRNSFMIGDSERDIQAASRLNVTGILITSDQPNKDNTALNLLDAVKKIILK